MPRYFTKKQKEIIWDRDNGICGICGEEADWGDWEADHIIPWAEGGETIVRNGMVTHPECNNYKRAKYMPGCSGGGDREVNFWNWDTSDEDDDYDEDDDDYEYSYDYSYDSNDSYNNYSYQSGSYNIADDIYAVSNALGKVGNWIGKKR